MNIASEISLKPFNTFGIDVKAKRFVTLTHPHDLTLLIRNNQRPDFILGGGSNLLLTKDIDGLVAYNQIKGIEVVRRFKDKVWVTVGGGEVWHDFVLWAVNNGFGGVENMSLIPGTVGAAPIQNIGAYGVELKDVFMRLTAIDLNTGKRHSFTRTQCAFGYRESVFKNTEKGRFFIETVTFSLKMPPHKVNVSYGDIAKTLEATGIAKPTIKDVSDAVIFIRQSKLPDPAKIGNSGSFFKNPEVPQQVLERIQTTHPKVPFFPVRDGVVKVPAGWLIEQCGWKGKRVGNTGSYEKQALVLVNHGGATGAEVRDLAYAIIKSVVDTFGIQLSPEVNII